MVIVMMWSTNLSETENITKQVVIDFRTSASKCTKVSDLKISLWRSKIIELHVIQ